MSHHAIKPRPCTLHMPVQAVPVTRGAAASRAGSPGVEADGLFDDILGTVGKVAGTALPILGSFGI